MTEDRPPLADDLLPLLRDGSRSAAERAVAAVELIASYANVTPDLVPRAPWDPDDRVEYGYQAATGFGVHVQTGLGHAEEIADVEGSRLLRRRVFVGPWEVAE